MKYATKHYTIRNNFPLDRTQCTCSESLDESGCSKEVHAVTGDDIYVHSYNITFVNNFVVVVLQMFLPAYYSIFSVADLKGGARIPHKSVEGANTSFGTGKNCNF